MGLSDLLGGHIEKRSQKILRKEVTKLGGTIEDVEVLEVDQQPGLARVLLVSQFGGETRSAKIRVSRIALDGATWVFVRPFAGAIMHPGELHAIVPGNLGGAAMLGRDGWHGAVAGLAGDAGLAAALEKFRWELRTHLVTALPWAIQLRPLGDGTSQLAMLSGTYVGVFSVGYGVAVFGRVRTAVAPLLTAPVAPAADFLHPCHGDLALRHLRQ